MQPISKKKNHQDFKKDEPLSRKKKINKRNINWIKTQTLTFLVTSSS